MDTMKSCYAFMLIVGVCAPADNDKAKIIGGLVRSIIVLTAMTLCVFQPCIRYFLQNLSNLVDATDVGLMVSIGFVATMSVVSFTIQQKQVLHTLSKLQSMVEKYSTGNSTSIFVEAEKQSDWYTKRIAAVMLGFVCSLVLSASVTISMILSFYKDVGPDGWMVPYRAIFPIDQSTFGRYCVILSLEMIGGFSILTCVSVIGSFYVSMCIYMIAFVNNYLILLNDIDEMAKCDTNFDKIKFKTKFTHLIQYHNEIYGLVENLIYLMRATIFSTLYGSVIFFATSIFQCEMTISKMNAELFVGISGLWMSIACMYVYSDFATEVTGRISTIGSEIYEKNWNAYPIEFWLFVQLTICRSHRPLYFHGFGLINCDMVTFSKLVNSAVSYYLMFRRMR